MRLLNLLHFFASLTVAWCADIIGQGSSFGGSLYVDWLVGYNALTRWQNSSSINYVSSSSDTGRASVINGTSAFAGTDTPVVSSELSWSTKSSDLALIPATGAAIVLGYSIPELTNKPGVYLNLSREAVAGIFLGDIKYWNDPAIASLNGAIQLPNETIRVMVRRDKSGTSQMFTSALSKFSTKFASVIGTSSSPNWTNVDYSATGNSGLAKAIYGTDYSIGYLGIGSTIQNNIPYATIQNVKGHFVRAARENLEPVFASITNVTIGNISQSFDTNDNENEMSYPIIGLTYFILYKTGDTNNCDTLRQTARFLYWAYTSPSASLTAINEYFLPLSGSMLDMTLNYLKNEITCINENGQREKLWAQSICDTGCVKGSCTYPSFGFQPAKETCQCELGWKNSVKNDCSESVQPTIMDFSRGSVTFIVILAILGILGTSAVALLIHKYRKNSVIKASSPNFCLISLCGIFFAYLDVFTYVGVPTNTACSAGIFTVSLASSIFFGTIASKTFRIYKIFHRMQLMRNGIGNKKLLLQSGIVVAFNVFFAVLWVAIDPPRIITVPTENEIQFVCQNKDFGAGYYIKIILLIYNGMLILFTTFLAVQVRNAGDMFNEAKALGISIYGVSTIAIFYFGMTFVPSLSSEVTFILRTISSIMCATTALVAIFGPKIHAIYVEPLTKGPLSLPSISNSLQEPMQVLVKSSYKAEAFCWNFYCRENGFATRWHEIKLFLLLSENQKGNGLVIIQDVSNPSEGLRVHCLQETKLIWDKTLSTSTHSGTKSNHSCGDPGSREAFNHNFARLVTTRGHYNLEGKTVNSLLALLQTFPAACSVTNGSLFQSKSIKL